MRIKEDAYFNVKVEIITDALDKAVPYGSKSDEVVYALCILLAHIFTTKGVEYVDKDEYIFELKQIISDKIEENEKK